ncbi:MAG: hypothetical protein HWE35_04195 [Rhodobacteraceae bacterium]|nr:hypothetical protein [Paracoccaceae bacterium]
MSLTDALLDRLPPAEVYQSTSMIRNYRENRQEFLDISHPRKLKALSGHWLHEAMMPALQRPLYLATSLRDPVSRVRSQYRFDIGLRGGRWAKPETGVFLQRNRNVMVNFLVNSFPTIAREYDDRVSAAKAILSGFDCVFDIADADAGINRLLTVCGVGGTPAARVNESGGVRAELEAGDAEIASYCNEDIAVYEWFKAAKAPQQGSHNAVFSHKMRMRFANLIGQPYEPRRVVEYLAPKYAAELHFGGPPLGEAMAAMRNKQAFTERVLARLSRLEEAAAGG